MTTSKLREYLQVLQDVNVMSFAGKWVDSETDTLIEFNVVMGPTLPIDTGGKPIEPGGWKTPDNLDNPDKLFNYDKEPNV